MKRSDPMNEIFARLPALLEHRPLLIEQGRFLDVDCLLGSTEQGFHVSIRAGRITDMTPAPVLMRSWQFGYRATPQAWTAFWQPMPKAGCSPNSPPGATSSAAMSASCHPRRS